MDATLREDLYRHLGRLAVRLGAGRISGRPARLLRSRGRHLGLDAKVMARLEREVEVELAPDLPPGLDRPFRDVLKPRLEYANLTRERAARWQQPGLLWRVGAGDVVAVRWSWANASRSPLPGDYLLLQGQLDGCGTLPGTETLRMGVSGREEPLSAQDARRFLGSGVTLSGLEGPRHTELPGNTTVWITLHVRILGSRPARRML